MIQWHTFWRKQQHQLLSGATESPQFRLLLQQLDLKVAKGRSEYYRFKEQPSLHLWAQPGIQATSSDEHSIISSDY